jgi:hypothetical protein
LRPGLRALAAPATTSADWTLVTGDPIWSAKRASRDQKFYALLQGCAPNVYHRSMFIIPYGAPEGYEWIIALVVLVGLYFAVRSFIRSRR